MNLIDAIRNGDLGTVKKLVKKVNYGVTNEIEKDLLVNVNYSKSNFKSIKTKSSKLISCPFHKDTNNSLAVYPKTNTFFCFGCRTYGSLETLKQVVNKNA